MVLGLEAQEGHHPNLHAPSLTLWQLLWLNRPLVKPAGQSWMRSIWCEFSSAPLGEIPSLSQVVKTAVEGLSENTNFVPSLACKQSGYTDDAWLAPCMMVKRWTRVLSLVHLRLDKIKGDAKARNHTAKRDFQLIKLAWTELEIWKPYWVRHDGTNMQCPCSHGILSLTSLRFPYVSVRFALIFAACFSNHHGKIPFGLATQQQDSVR